LCPARSESGVVELAPWLAVGSNRVVVMHISTDCRDVSLQCARTLVLQQPVPHPASVFTCSVVATTAYSSFAHGLQVPCQSELAAALKALRMP
jgi:hypothetical protein